MGIVFFSKGSYEAVTGRVRYVQPCLVGLNRDFGIVCIRPVVFFLCQNKHLFPIAPTYL